MTTSELAAQLRKRLIDKKLVDPSLLHSISDDEVIGSDALSDLQSIVCRRGSAEPAPRGKESHCRAPQESR